MRRLPACRRIVVEQEAVRLVFKAQRLGNFEIDALDVFVPVLDLPRVAVGFSLHHARLADCDVGDDPDDAQFCAVLREFSRSALM